MIINGSLEQWEFDLIVLCMGDVYVGGFFAENKAVKTE